MKKIALILSLFISTLSYAAPKSELWPYWATSNEQGNQTISHSKWQHFLDNYVVKKGENTLVRYNSVSESGKQSLKSYLADLSQLDPREYNRTEQYAYWVNLYNALTVDLILDNYPVKSITKLGGLFSFGPWDKEVVVINGKALSLNDVEHRILRPVWQDPRTHYAVNCASIGCPNLQLIAFTADNQDELLEQAATSFINSKKGVNTGSGKIVLSSIYDWFAADFGVHNELKAHLKTYRPALSIDLKRAKYDYDWALNEFKE